MGLQRKAGDALRASNSIDQKFSEDIINMYLGLGEGKKHPERYEKLGEYLGGTSFSEFGQKGVPLGAAYTSAASRYVAPAIGIGMAGNAVGSVTNAVFGGPEDGQQPGQLDVGGLTVASLMGAVSPYAAHQALQYGGGVSPEVMQFLSGSHLDNPALRKGGLAAAGAAGTVLANALGQAIF